MSSKRDTSKKSDEKNWRLFAAVPLTEPVRNLIADIQDELEPEGWPIKWVDPALAHITVKFYGDTPVQRVDELKEQLALVAGRNVATTVTTGQLGAFPSLDSPRVVWLGLEGSIQPLKTMARDVDDVSADLGFARERRGFQAHITLGRFRDAGDAPEEVGDIIRDIGLPSHEFHADRLQLLRSVLRPDGPQYSTIGEWMLEGQGAPGSPDPKEHG